MEAGESGSPGLPGMHSESLPVHHYREILTQPKRRMGIELNDGILAQNGGSPRFDARTI